jgi:hypothetical protein
MEVGQGYIVVTRKHKNTLHHQLDMPLLEPIHPRSPSTRGPTPRRAPQAAEAPTPCLVSLLLHTFDAERAEGNARLVVL